MMAMTKTSARPATFCDGTIGAALRCGRGTASTVMAGGGGVGLRRGLVSHGCPAFPPVEDHAPRVDLVHQAEIVGGDDDGGAEPVELDEQAQQPARQRRIDIAGRLVGEQDLGLLDQRPGDRRALLFAARKHRRQHMHALAEADPFQQFDHVGAIARFLAAAHPQRQRDVLVGGHVVEQAEILEHHADPAAHQRQFLRARCASGPCRRC